MDDEVNTKQEQIINKLKSLLEIKYVYESTVKSKDVFKPLLIVILKGNCSSLTHELSSMVAKIFQDETDYLYRIFSFHYAQQQLKEDNLFFVHGCAWEKVIYHHPDAELDSFHEYRISKKTLRNIQSAFEKEQNKIAAFLDGAIFFMEKKNLSHTAYMLHQYIELWFRFSAFLIMGKERKSHSIKELQTYINSFSPKLGKLFNTEIEEELNLLKLLDDAYITTRYENNYHINLEQVLEIQEKTKLMYTLVSRLFADKMSACQKNLNKQYYKTDTCLTKEDSSNKEVPEANGELILDKIKKLTEEHSNTLKPHPHRKDIFHINLITDGYLETSIMIANLIKVCIMALEAGYIPNRLVKEPEHNIREVLGYILYMMPYEKMELLDKVKDLLKGKESEC